MIGNAITVLILENNIVPTAVWSNATRLAGTITRPRDAGPHPAALLLSGSGPLDRDSNTSKMRLDVSRAMAEGLAAHGIASLRYDKRGVRASGGDYLSAGFDDETADAGAALATLRAHPDVDADRVVVIGHSVGATIAMRMAWSPAPPAAYAFLAGAAMTGEEVMVWQTRRIATTLPRPRRLRARRFERSQARHRATLLGSTTDTARIGWIRWNTRWFREYMTYDPIEALAIIDRPVLAITGANDIQVDPQDVARIGRVVTGHFDGDVPADLTHLLRRHPGAPSLATYRRQLREPVDAWVVDRVAAWARSHVG